MTESIGANDVNSKHGPILPWLRSIDGFNTHDDSFELAMAGGVTSAQVLPGSANAIGKYILNETTVYYIDLSTNFLGGQAFMVKLRKTAEKSPFSMIVEPPHSLDGTESSFEHFRWRHLQYTASLPFDFAALILS